MVSRMFPEEPGRQTPIKSAVSPKRDPKFSKLNHNLRLKFAADSVEYVKNSQE